jgi:hypothetical protein
MKTLQHYLNPLHIYCRLRSVMDKRSAVAISHAYERALFRPIVAHLINL